MKLVLFLLVSVMIVPMFVIMFLTPPQKVVFVNCFYYKHDQFGGTCEIMDQVVQYHMKNREMRLFGSDKFRKTIEYVKIVRSDFDFIPDQIFKSFKNLKRMDVYNTTLESLDQSSFVGAENLKYLSLDNNNIKFLDENTFENFKNLETLSVQDNQITYLGVNLFNNCEKLKQISFKNNDIQMIDESLRKGVKNFDFSGNPCVTDDYASLEKCFENAKNSEMVNQYKERLNEYKVDIRARHIDKEVESQTQMGFIESTTPFLKLAYIILIICYVGYNLWKKLVQGQKKKSGQKRD